MSFVLPASKANDYEPHIDGLRAIAVLLVVFYHALPEIVPGGYIGVDVFFVISGYLITRLILRELNGGTFSIRRFYGRRIRRIFPALALVLGATLAVGWIILLPDEWEALGRHAAMSAAFVVNFAFMREGGYFDTPFHAKPLLHLWSLSIEEQFYLFWPLIIVVATRFRSSGLWGLVALVALSFFAALMIGDPRTAYFSTLTRAWELTMGGLLAWCETRRWANRTLATSTGNPIAAPGILAIGGLSAILLSALVFDRSTSFPGPWAALPVLGALAVVIGARSTGIARSALTVRCLVAIGLISYPLYLWHWPLLAFLHMVQPADPGTTVRAIFALVALPLALLTYGALERPIRRRGAMTAVALFYLVAACGLLGYYASLGRVETLSSKEASAIVGATKRDWVFPPPGMRTSMLGDGIVAASTSPQPPEVVVIGDSNAQQYAIRADWLSREGQSRAVTFVTLEGCIPIERIESPTRPGCLRFRERATEAALQPSVKTVVLVAQWLGYFSWWSDFEVMEPDGPSLSLNPSGGPERFDRAFAKVEDAIARFQEAGKQVVVVLNTPTGRELDPVSSINRPVVSRWLTALPEFVSRRSVVEHLKPVNQRFDALSTKLKFDVIDPTVWLCDDVVCPKRNADGSFRYLDGTHLRASFVRDEVKFLDHLIANGMLAPTFPIRRAAGSVSPQ